MRPSRHVRSWVVYGRPRSSAVIPVGFLLGTGHKRPARRGVREGALRNTVASMRHARPSLPAPCNFRAGSDSYCGWRKFADGTPNAFIRDLATLQTAGRKKTCPFGMPKVFGARFGPK